MTIGLPIKKQFKYNLFIYIKHYLVDLNNDPHSLGLRGEREDMEDVIVDDRAVGGSQLHGVQISLQ